MQVNITDNTGFRARNKTIRFADDIARRVNQCYPRISPSKLSSYRNARKHVSMLEDISEKLETEVRQENADLYDEADSFCKRIHSFIKPIKKNTIGNCGESGQLAAIIAKMNGIKNCHLAQLYTIEEKDLDHTVLFVNDEKPYIIDTWLGFADYVENALLKYRTIYRNIFDDVKDEDTITFLSYTDDEYANFLKNDFTRKQINKLKKIYPDHFIRRGYVE